MRKIRWAIAASAGALVLAAATAAANDCKNPADDGDCCSTDADCVAYPYKTLCATIPLNKTAVAKLEEDRPPILGICTPERIRELEAEARRAKVRCDGGSCTLE